MWQRFWYGRCWSAIVQCTASRTRWCEATVTKLFRVLALEEVLHVVSIVCVDIGVVKGAVQSKPAVNSTLVYFNLTPTSCLSAFYHGSWLSDLVYVFLFILSSKKQPWRRSSVHWCLDIFGILSSLSLEALRGKKENKMHSINLRNSWWTNPASCLLLSFLFPVSSLVHNNLSTLQQYVWKGLQKIVARMINW